MKKLKRREKHSSDRFDRRELLERGWVREINSNSYSKSYNGAYYYFLEDYRRDEMGDKWFLKRYRNGKSATGESKTIARGQTGRELITIMNSDPKLVKLL